MQFLTPDITVTPPAVVQGVRRLPAINYAAPGYPVTTLRLEALRKMPAGTAHGLSTASGSPASGPAKHVIAMPRLRAQLPLSSHLPLSACAESIVFSDKRPGLAPKTGTGGSNRAGDAGGFRPYGRQCQHAGTIPGTKPRALTAAVRVYFATDSARLTAAAIRQLRALPKSACYTVVGHADPRPVGVAGSYRLNLTLSARRALAVARVLDDRGDRATIEARSWLGASTRPSRYRFDRRAAVLVAARGAACNGGGR